MNYNRAGSINLIAYETDGDQITPNENTGLLTLSNATYYIEVGNGVRAPAITETALASVHLKWSSALAATITFETTNFPRYRNGDDRGPDDTTPYYNTSDGTWIPEDPAGAEVEVVGTGNSATGLVITAGGTNAGGAMVHIGNLGARRIRIKVVATTGGTLRVVPNAKLGA